MSSANFITNLASKNCYRNSLSIDLEEIYTDVTSRLWFTYRKGFQPIGNSTE